MGLSAATLLALHQLPGGVPKGYLRVLSFNEDSVLVDQRTVQLSAAALNNYEPLQTGPLVVQQNGYVSVYVGNESAADVYFDDVRIEHRQGLQVQENQYDPFGLDLAGVSGAAPGLRLKNFYQFNGKENQLDLGLNWNHQDWRFFDYQIGRWHVVDPDIEAGQESWTPYHFGFDNAVRYADADGRCPDGCPPNPWDGLKGSGNAASSPDLLSAITTPFKNFVGDALALTDVNDATVIVTMVTRGSGAINVDGSNATNLDRGFAVAGAVIPFVSGALVKKGFQAVGNFTVNAYGKFKHSGLADGHHIIQNAAVKNLPGYAKEAAPAVHLPGGGKGTPHHAASRTQAARRKLGDGGTYGSERRIAYRAMRAAGANVDDAKKVVRKADEYFSTLGVTTKTPTHTPSR